MPNVIEPSPLGGDDVSSAKQEETSRGGETPSKGQLITGKNGLKLARCYVCEKYVPLCVIKKHVKLRHGEALPA